MIFITGDTHGGIDIKKFSSSNFLEGRALTKDDYVIICGDFGCIWDGSREQAWLLNWYKDKPWTTLFVDGNHENFDMLYDFPVEEWNGGKTHRINGSVLHLMRGQIFSLAGLKFFTFGGAMSTDKIFRQEHVSWWSQEIPSREEEAAAILNLTKHNFAIDYIVTHTAPTAIVEFLNRFDRLRDPTSGMLDKFVPKLQFKHWYFGHFHTSQRINDQFTCLYNEIIRLV